VGRRRPPARRRHSLIVAVRTAADDELELPPPAPQGVEVFAHIADTRVLVLSRPH
jgi:hypothetical protein